MIGTMIKKEHQEVSVAMQIRAIELLNSSLHYPANPTTASSTFNFSIRIESKADAANKLVFVIVHVDIKTEDLTLVLGSLSLSCIYEIADFDAVIKMDAGGNLVMPESLIETLNSHSISTTRGVMFSTFRGSFLHGAVLPLVGK